MKQLAEPLVSVIAAADLRLQGLDESTAAHKTAPEVWSMKELLGHLIDSASNNISGLYGCNWRMIYGCRSTNRKAGLR